MSSKIPSVRAVEELEDYYKKLISNIKKSSCSDAHEQIANERKDIDKKAISEIISAINKLGLPYKFQSTDVCNIRHTYGTGYLQFNLDFVPSKTKSLAKMQKIIDDSEIEENKRLKRLQDWKTKSLYNIANRKEIDVFEVE